MLYLLLIPAVLILVLLVVLTPKKGGKNAPPMISSTVQIPVVGPALEFVKSPLAMVKRCYDEYGPVYTVPVSE